MGDEPAILPHMQLVPGWLEIEAQPRLGAEIEADLVRRARRRAGDGAGKAPVDRAVQMAAEDALCTLYTSDAAAELISVHVGGRGIYTI